MKQKNTTHDPMKTVTTRIMHDWGYETITHKEKHTKHMEHLVAKIQWHCNEMMIQTKMATTESERKEIITKFVSVCNRFMAENDAEYLIANNIARRGKPLHPDTAIKKLDKTPGTLRAWCIKQSIMDIVNDKLHPGYDLGECLKRKFGVTLMDKNAYENCQEMINVCKGADKKLQHYENFAKKFHKSVINKVCYKNK